MAAARPWADDPEPLLQVPEVPLPLGLGLGADAAYLRAEADPSGAARPRGVRRVRRDARRIGAPYHVPELEFVAPRTLAFEGISAHLTGARVGIIMRTRRAYDSRGSRDVFKQSLRASGLTRSEIHAQRSDDEKTSGLVVGACSSRMFSKAGGEQ